MLALAAGALPISAFAQAPAATAPAAPAATAPAPAADPAPAAAPADTTPAAPASSSDTAAPAKPMAKKHMMSHKMGSKHMGKLAPTKAGDKAVEDLNDASLNSAKSGKPFMAPTTPAAAKMEAHKPMHKKMMHHMAKKKASAAPASDAAAPAPDSSATPPADNSGK